MSTTEVIVRSSAAEIMKRRHFSGSIHRAIELYYWKSTFDGVSEVCGDPSKSSLAMRVRLAIVRMVVASSLFLNNTHRMNLTLRLRLLSRLALWIVLFVALPVVTVSVDGREMTRGARWVRSHPFMLTALTIIPTMFEVDQYYGDLHLNTLLAWKSKTGLFKKAAAASLPWHFHLRSHVGGLTDQHRELFRGLKEKYGGCTGWMIWDEPQRVYMEEAARSIAWAREHYPEILIYSNALPQGNPNPSEYYGEDPPGGEYSYDQYLYDFATILKPDVLMFDIYPFMESGETKNMFPTIMTTRRLALERGLPYWAFVQSYSDPVRKYRMPSESDIRMQVFLLLTYGYTGISYFTYEDLQGPGMITNDRTPRPIFHHISRLNQEVSRIGQSLRFLTSTEASVVVGPGSQLREEAIAWSSQSSENGPLRAVAIEDSHPDMGKDVAIGSFRDDDGRRYCMVTNLWHGPGLSASERQLSVLLTLDPSVKFVGRLSRETGAPELLAVRDGKLRLTLPGGTGDLLCWGNDYFPGLEGDEEWIPNTTAPSKSLTFREARVQVTGYDHNRPEDFPGLGDFIGWAETIERMPNGDLLLAHSAGYWHASFASPRLFPSELRKHWGSEGWPLDFPAPTGGRSMACRSTDNGRTWSKPFLLIDYRLDDRPHSLFTCRDGTVLCFINTQASWYGFKKAPEEFSNDPDLGELNGKQFVIRSTDNGATWSEPIWIDGPGLRYERAHGRPIQLADGGILWATYNSGHESGTRSLYGAIQRSDDSGKSWRVVSVIHRKDQGNNIDEPAIAELKDGRIIMVTRKDGGVLYSSDEGVTWTEPGYRVTTKPGKFKAPQVFVLKDGTVVVIATLGTLRAWLSRDGGVTWTDDIPLDPTCYGYPGAVLLDDESIVVSYCESGRAPNRVFVIKLRVNEARDGVELLSLR